MASSHLLFCILLLLVKTSLSVPFVTKRVSLHNPITIDFSGWRPLKLDQLSAQSSVNKEVVAAEPQKKPTLDDHFLTVPVAVETDAEHVLSESDLNQIRDRVIDNWRQQPIRSESFPQLRPLVTKLLPKPEVERETGSQSTEGDSEEEYTFVKMSRKSDHGKTSSANDTARDEDNLFHAYFAPKEHVPEEGYVRMTRDEFRRVFKNAEILFV